MDVLLNGSVFDKIEEIGSFVFSLIYLSINYRNKTIVFHLGFLDKFTLRECIEKLELLKTPEERHRRLREIPEVHADPNMDPNCDSDQDAREIDNKKQGPLLCQVNMELDLYTDKSYLIFTFPGDIRR